MEQVVLACTAGKNFGLAFESNIWNMSMVASPTLMGTEASYDAFENISST